MPADEATRVSRTLISDRYLSDRALRLWIALKKWATRDRWPTNSELAAECGWYAAGSDRPSTQKVKAAFRELEACGYVERQLSPGCRSKIVLRGGAEVAEEPTCARRSEPELLA